MSFETIKDNARISTTSLGTGQLIYRITDLIYIILTCAHNFVEFKNKRIHRLGDRQAYFLLQSDGDIKKKAKFNLLKYYIFPRFEKTGNFSMGEDIALAAVEM